MIRAYTRSPHVCTCAVKDTSRLVLEAGYPILKKNEDDVIPKPDEKYDAEESPSDSTNNMSGPQAKMPFLNKYSVEKACIALKASNDYPCKMMITYKGHKRPWTNIPQCLHKFVIRSVLDVCVLALITHAYLCASDMRTCLVIVFVLVFS